MPVLNFAAMSGYLSKRAGDPVGIASDREYRELTGVGPEPAEDATPTGSGIASDKEYRELTGVGKEPAGDATPTGSGIASDDEFYDQTGTARPPQNVRKASNVVLANDLKNKRGVYDPANPSMRDMFSEYGSNMSKGQLGAFAGGGALIIAAAMLKALKSARARKGTAKAK